MAVSPTQRTLQYCRDQGWQAGIVERWIQQAKRRVDLFGCIDLIVLPRETIGGDLERGYCITEPGYGILGIQACAAASHAARVAKATAEPRLRNWLEAGGRFEVWSWKKYAKPIDRKYWRVRREAVTLADLP